jgi:hypothetical protein
MVRVVSPLATVSVHLQLPVLPESTTCENALLVKQRLDAVTKIVTNNFFIFFFLFND